jgi:hypothetical protein
MGTGAASALKMRPEGARRIMVDIFEFWSKIGRGEKIHPADRSAFARMDARDTDFASTAYRLHSGAGFGTRR